MKDRDKNLDKLLQGFAKMSGEKKVLIGLRLSELARRVRKEGAKATKTAYGIGPR